MQKMRDISFSIIPKLNHSNHKLSPIVAHARGIYANSITTRDHNLESNTTPISKGLGLKKWIDSGDLTCCHPHNCRYLLIKAKLPPYSISTIGSELEYARRQYWQPTSICGRKIGQGPCVFRGKSIILSLHIPESRHHRIISKSTASHSIRSPIDLALMVQRWNLAVII